MQRTRIAPEELVREQNETLTVEERREMRHFMREVEKATLALEAAQVAQKAFVSMLVDKYDLMTGDNVDPRSGVITRA